MISHIIQIEENPISRHDDHYLSLSDIEAEDWFLCSIADWAFDLTPAEISDAVEGFHKYLGDTHITWHNQTCFSIHEGFQQLYFSKRLNRLISAVQKASELCSVDDLLEGEELELCAYCIRDAVNDKFGRYVYDQDEELHTLDHFVRTAEINVPYYIGSVVGYHY